MVGTQSPGEKLPAVLAEVLPPASLVSLSSYRYVEGSLGDDRQVYTFGIADLSDRFAALSDTIEKNQDVAFHSLVGRPGGSADGARHIPMVDFKPPIIEEGWSRLVDVLAGYRCTDGALFFSGQSWHLYGLSTVDDKEWPALMGSLLLVNSREGRDLVDQRWVGHRLRAGYCSLRWTANQAKYKRLPCLVFLGELRRLRYRVFSRFAREVENYPEGRRGTASVREDQRLLTGLFPQ